MIEEIQAYYRDHVRAATQEEIAVMDSRHLSWYECGNTVYTDGEQFWRFYCNTINYPPGWFWEARSAGTLWLLRPMGGCDETAYCK